MPELDHLRFVAASLVVLFHTRLLTSGGGRSSNPFAITLIDQGHIGVQLFMVVSGFLMMNIFCSREMQPLKFYLNRMLRIYPLFILIVSLGYFSTPDPRPTSVGINYILALLPISNLYRLEYGPFGGQMWTIAVELQFYLLFPLLLKFRRTYGHSFYVAMFAGALALRAVQFAASGTAHTFTFFSLFGSIDLFIAGMLAAECYQASRRKDTTVKPFWAAAALMAIVIAIIAAFSHRSFFHIDYDTATTDGISRSAIWIVWPTILAGLFGSLLLAYLLSSKSIPWSNALSNFGKWSYSTYVWHILVIELLKDKMLYLPSYALGLLIAALMVGVSYLSYRLIEMPFLNLRSMYPAQSSAVASTMKLNP